MLDLAPSSLICSPDSVQSTLYITKPLNTTSAMSPPPASHCAICHSQHQTNRKWRVKPASRCKNHYGVLHFWGFLFIKSIFNAKSNQEEETLKCKKDRKHSNGGDQEADFTHPHVQQRHFTWFPRKNYNKSSRHGAQEQEEKEKEQE